MYEGCIRGELGMYDLAKPRRLRCQPASGATRRFRSWNCPHSPRYHRPPGAYTRSLFGSTQALSVG